MIPCQNCGKVNTTETNFCRFCGTKFMVRQSVMENPYDYAAPRPYAWKTDEFQASNEPRSTIPIDAPHGTAAPLVYQQSQPFGTPFRCQHCMSQFPPRIERRISTTGWVTFAVLLVVFFPLFWIGLLIKEDVQVCQSCNSKAR